MSTPKLTKPQRDELFEPLFSKVISDLEFYAKGDQEILRALRRKLTKELSYLERGCPRKRGSLKRKKRIEQNNLCAICNGELPDKGAHLCRLQAADSYTLENTRLIHHHCHLEAQEKKNQD
jgi:hypothetical protein